MLDHMEQCAQIHALLMRKYNIVSGEGMSPALTCATAAALLCVWQV